MDNSFRYCFFVSFIFGNHSCNSSLFVTAIALTNCFPHGTNSMSVCEQMTLLELAVIFLPIFLISVLFISTVQGPVRQFSAFGSQLRMTKKLLMRHCSYSVKSSDSTGDHREGTIENAKMYYCSWISGFEMQQNTIRSKPHYSNAPICVYSVCFCVEYEGFSMRCYCLSLLPATHQHCCKCALVECGFS